MPHVTDGFGVIPHGLDRPLAVFSGLSEAIEWGHLTIGERQYRVRYVRAVPFTPAMPADARSGPREAPSPAPAHPGSGSPRGNPIRR
jgi:hypothetical protein